MNQILKLSGYDISIPPRNRRGLGNADVRSVFIDRYFQFHPVTARNWSNKLPIPVVVDKFQLNPASSRERCITPMG